MHTRIKNDENEKKKKKLYIDKILHDIEPSISLRRSEWEMVTLLLYFWDDKKQNLVKYELSSFLPVGAK